MTGASGELLDQWDVHVGAELSLLGRKVVIKKVSWGPESAAASCSGCGMAASRSARKQAPQAWQLLHSR